MTLEAQNDSVEITFFRQKQYTFSSSLIRSQNQNSQKVLNMVIDATSALMNESNSMLRLSNKRRNSLLSSPNSIMSTPFDLPILPGLVFNGVTLPFDLPLLDQTSMIQKEQPLQPKAEESLLDVFSEDFDDVANVVSSEDECSQPTRKRRKTSKNSSSPNKFRPYQAEKWQERFDELIEFRKTNGNCLVPHTFPANPPLARWVKRQRYQYKLLMEGKQSSMTTDRIRVLEEIGFIWDSHEAAWEDRLRELLEYKKSNGNCLVPSNYPSNPQLATWVKCQRRQYKLYWEGRPSNMTVERIMELEQHGFEWELRSSAYVAKKKEKTQDDKKATVPKDDGEFDMFMNLLDDLSEGDNDLSL